MRWSVRLVVIGVLIILLGFIPPVVRGVSMGSLEGAASLIATGLLVLLVGLMLRKLQKSME